MKKVRFEWDAKKDKENQEKHGVSFEFAQYAWALTISDPLMPTISDPVYAQG